MDIEKEDIIIAFEKSIRNRYYKLFDYYEHWFLNKTYLAFEVAHKISVDLGVIITPTSVKYIRSRILKKRLSEKAKKLDNSEVSVNSSSHFNHNKVSVNHLVNSTNDFAFKEPKSIDNHQDIVTIRKSGYETN